MEQKEQKELELLATMVRRDVVEMLLHRGYGHLGGSLSIVELMAVLYGKQLKHDPKNPKWEDRDRLVLSKGHAGPAWYSVLAERGFFDRDMLFTLNDGGTNLPSHPDCLKTPGVDMTTGSLGQGCSTAAGIATALAKKGSDAYTYLVVGDGELNEGQCWEAFQYIANYKMDNLIVFLDENKRQLDGWTKDIMNPFDLEAKMRAFGFYTQKVNGQDIVAVDAAITEAKEHKGEALCIVLDTVKGAGVKYFEDMVSNHAPKFAAEADKQAARDAIDSLNAKIAELEGEVA